MKEDKDILIAVALFVVLLAAFLATQDSNKLKVIEVMLTGSFGAVVAMLQAKVRQTLKGDVVQDKVEINQ